MAAVLLLLSALCFFSEKDTYSESERRALAKFPEISLQTVSNGSFAAKFEEYATDTFPKRDLWRGIKAYTRLYGFLQKDNNGIFQKNGYLSKIEYPKNVEMQDHAIDLFGKINERYLSESHVYFSMIPDKNLFISDLSYDYGEMEKYMADNMPYAIPIQIMPLLSKEDFYYTDTHWRQEEIIPVAEHIARSMGESISEEYETVRTDTPFYGVYAGQSALNVQPDELCYLTNETIRSYEISVLDTAGKIELSGAYDMSKLRGKDPYEMFLSGNRPVVTIKNPQADNNKRLVIFRDSFGSSIAPLLAEGYSETVLIDLRYIGSDFLSMAVDFKDADVLFLYSSLILNSSLSMK